MQAFDKSGQRTFSQYLKSLSDNKNINTLTLICDIFSYGSQGNEFSVEREVLFATPICRKAAEMGSVYAKLILSANLSYSWKTDEALSISTQITSTDTHGSFDYILFQHYYEQIFTYPLALHHLVKAAEKNHVKSQVLLGDIFLSGKLFQDMYFGEEVTDGHSYFGPNFEQAEKWYRLASISGNEIANKKLSLIAKVANGAALFRDEKYAEAQYIFLEVLKQDASISLAHEYLGFIYKNADNDIKNLQKAEQHFDKCAEMGSDTCIFHYAYKYAGDSNASQDDRIRGFELYNKIASVNEQAKWNKAVMLHNGEGVRRDRYKSYELFKELAEKKYELAIKLLADSYKKGDSQYIKSDLLKAEDYYLKLVKYYPTKENRKSLVWFYLKQHNYKSAIDILNTPTPLVYPEFYFSVGLVASAANDHQIATLYFGKASELGYKVAIGHYAKALFFGEGISQNSVAARELLLKISNEDYEYRDLILGIILLEKATGSTDIEEAAKLLKLAKERGQNIAIKPHSIACELLSNSDYLGKVAVCANEHASIIADRLAACSYPKNSIERIRCDEPEPAVREYKENNSSVDTTLLGLGLAVIGGAILFGDDEPSFSNDSNNQQLSNCQAKARARISQCVYETDYSSCTSSGCLSELKCSRADNNETGRVCTSFFERVSAENGNASNDFYCDTENPDNRSENFQVVVNNICSSH